MTDEHPDQTFRELQAELAVIPSAEFAANVRARVAEAPAREWFGGWGLAAASVVTAGSVFMESGSILAGFSGAIKRRNGAAEPPSRRRRLAHRRDE